MWESNHLLLPAALVVVGILGTVASGVYMVVLGSQPGALAATGERTSGWWQLALSALSCTVGAVWLLVVAARKRGDRSDD